MVGLMIARSLTLPVLHEVASDWPVFAGGVISVIVIAALLGWSVARLGVLPGATAIWGPSPGAAQVMTINIGGFQCRHPAGGVHTVHARHHRCRLRGSRCAHLGGSR
ncbi:AbrB family transcriptional regulator [Breoghania sp.]|uniref:AbrB family transcriptional regulator n=1 Tax=Breoghania sp. TaxID=2065378 RepID=UPI002612A3CD|nr:AbrB family transcriptional regulator [Breoghania sp.]MDJ0931431.1 AbrB family transcriptional regulator [Breoghania sp.]